MLSQASENLSPLDWISTMDAVECDATKLPLDDGSSDIALTMHMFYHVVDQDAAIREFARVVRSGGKAAMSTNGLDNSIPLSALAKEAFRGSGRDPGAELFSPHTGYELFSRHFSRVEIHELTDAADIFVSLTSMPPGNSASEEEQEHLKALLEE